MNINLSKRLSHNQVRYMTIPFLALVLAHLVAYKKLPFEEGYQFPLPAFIFSIVICLACCEINTFSYNKFSKKWSLKAAPKATIIKQIGVSLLLTTFIFATLVYSVNYILFGYISPLSRFLSSLLVALLIISVETLVYILRDFKRAQESTDLAQQPVQSWQFISGSKTLVLEPQEVAYVYSQGGLVYIVTNDGEKHLSQFSSLNELNESNDTSAFFRLNRQFMISQSAIREVQKDVNQKLRVTLAPLTSSIPSEAVVSRYTSPEFKRWMKASH